VKKEKAVNAFTDTYRRIQLATNTRTQSELAKVLEVCQSSVSDAKRRGTIPSGWYTTLFEKCGLSQDWLRYGIGPTYLRTEQGYLPQEIPAEGVREEAAHYGDPAAKARLVTVYSMVCQANGEDVMPDLEAIGKLALPSSFAGQDTLVLRMHHNDMAHTIRRGAYFGVDATDTQPVSGGIFVLKDDHVGLLARRIFLNGGSERRYYLRSDDAQCPESTLSPEELAVRTLGQVVWVMQKIV
jgi:phage repressor protein C with HTH and peptisase S24 domain